MAGAAEVLGAMRDRGEIHAWGMGLNLVEPALACLEAAKPDLFLIAGRYTLLDHTALGKLFPACLATYHQLSVVKRAGRIKFGTIHQETRH